MQQPTDTITPDPVAASYEVAIVVYALAKAFALLGMKSGDDTRNRMQELFDFLVAVGREVIRVAEDAAAATGR